MCRRVVSMIVAMVLVIGILLTQSSSAKACPFCSAQAQTFTEEITTMDAVVLAKLIQSPPPAKADDTSLNQEVPKAKFEIVQVIKGKSHLGDLGALKAIETIYFGDAKPGKLFLIMGVDPPKLMWSTPVAVTDRAKSYITSLLDVPKEGAARMEFFQEYLEDSDEMLARDAYDEFAKTPYSSVIELKPKMKHDQLVAWIKDVNIPASRRRLYLTMLGVCGSKDDVAMLEEMLKSDDRKARAGLDALIGCYLTLTGSEGMPLVEELFLKNQKCEYADTYSAIMALRFHGSETTVIPKPRLLQGLHYMLERPQLADLVIPDLARWEDWSQMDRLVKLFKEADEKSSWVRVPVVNYLRACPLPEAKERIKELEKIDPGAVKRANSFFPFGGGAPAAPAVPAKTTSIEKSNPLSEATKQSPVAAGGKRPTEVASANRLDPVTTDLVRQTSAPDRSLLSANRLRLVGVTWLTGAILMLVQWTILRGRSVG